MNRYQTTVCLLLLCSMQALAGFAVATDTEQKSIFKVGAIFGLTGLLPDLGDQFLKGSELYLQSDARESKHLSLLIEDSKWETATAVSAFKKLVEVDAVQAVYVMGSGPSLAIKPLSEARGILLFSAGAHPQLVPGSSFVIRHANLASEDAAAFASFVSQKVGKEAVLATVYLQNDWGQNYDGAFRAALQVSAPKVKVISESHQAGESDFRIVLLRLFKSSPEALVLNSAGISLALLIEQARQLGFKGPIFVNNGLALSIEAQERILLLKDNNIFSQRYPDLPDSFVRAYSSLYKTKPGYFSLVSFTDMELLNYAVSKVGNDNSKIVAFIKGLGTFSGLYATLNISPEGDILIPTVVRKFE